MKALQRRTLLTATAVLAVVGLAATALPAGRPMPSPPGAETPVHAPHRQGQTSWPRRDRPAAPSALDATAGCGHRSRHASPRAHAGGPGPMRSGSQSAALPRSGATVLR